MRSCTTKSLFSRWDMQPKEWVSTLKEQDFEFNNLSKEKRLYNKDHKETYESSRSI